MLFIYLESIFGFKAPATPIMEGIIDLHNYIFFYLILVFIFVLWMYLYIIVNYYIYPTFMYDVYNDIDEYDIDSVYEKDWMFSIYVKYLGINEEDMGENKKLPINFFKESFETLRTVCYVLVQERFEEISVTRQINHGTLIEIIWTIIPSLILVLIAIPSFALLYSMDEIADPKLTVKAIGYQWFWTYEYAHDFDVLEYNYLKDSLGYTQRFYREALVYDSVMLSEEDLNVGYHRLLDVDHQMILPANVHIRLMVTAGDVLHSWAVPSLGIKIDAVPGRMSQVGIYMKHEGVFYGQCSELCGVNHGFMPIVVKVVSYENFLEWYRNVDYVWNDSI